MKLIYQFFIPCIFLFMACEEIPFEPPEERVRTYLHFLNTYDGFPGVDVNVTSFEKNQTLVKNLAFGEGWPVGGYASLLTVPDEDTTNNIQGGITVEVLNAATQAVAVPATKLKLNAKIGTTLALVDSFGKPILVKTIDNIPNPSDSVGQVRFMNVNNSNLSVSLTTTDENFQIPNLNFLNYSNFRALKSGVYSFYFVDDFSGIILDSISRLSIERHQIYSFFLSNRGGKAVGGYEKLEQNVGRK